MCDNVDLHVFLSVGPVISGYVQLCGQRNRLCKLLSNGKYLWALKVKCVILVGLAYNICVSSYWSCCSSQKFRRSITGSLWRFCRVCCHRSKLTRVRLSTSTFTSERTSLVKWWLSSVCGSVSKLLSVAFWRLHFNVHHGVFQRPGQRSHRMERPQRNIQPSVAGRLRFLSRRVSPCCSNVAWRKRCETAEK